MEKSMEDDGIRFEPKFYIICVCRTTFTARPGLLGFMEAVIVAKLFFVVYSTELMCDGKRDRISRKGEIRHDGILTTNGNAFKAAIFMSR